MPVSTKKQQERKKFWVRVLCVVLSVLMVASTLLAVFEII